MSGNVTNGSTGKAAAGVSVTLVDPMSGMAELATGKTDAQGHFEFDVPAAKGPRLARAERGGVNYFKMVTPGSTSVDIEVYDAVPSLEGISGSADVVTLQADGSALQAVELFALKNASNPPRTLAARATFEFVLPAGAQIEGADVQGPNGQPISGYGQAGEGKESLHVFICAEAGRDSLPDCLSFSIQRQASAVSASDAQFRALRAGDSVHDELCVRRMRSSSRR